MAWNISVLCKFKLGFQSHSSDQKASKKFDKKKDNSHENSVDISVAFIL